MAAPALMRRPGRRGGHLVLLTAVALGTLTGCGPGATDRRSESSPTTAAASTRSLPVPDDSQVPLGPTEPTASAGTSDPTTTQTPAGPPARTPPTPAGAGRPCPAAVAATLPAVRGALLVAGYETNRFRLYYCQTPAGRLYYHGVSKADPTHVVTLPGAAIPGGYEARALAEGHAYIYRVVGGNLIVVEDGTVIRTDPVIGNL